MIRLHTFGGCFLERGGRRMDSISGQRKALALLLVLAAAGERGVTRDTLIGYFWPESDEERARTSLRQLVHLLRTQLAAPDLLLSSAELRLNPAEITSDVADFRKAVAAGDLNTAAELYQGSFAEGFYLSGTDEFERWIATERADLAHNAARALESLAENAMARGDGRAAVDLWRRLAQNEPLSTRATLGLMRALDSTGERAAALKHAREYERLVREDLDGAPDPSVVALAAELQRERPLPPISTVARISAPAAPTHSESSHAPAAALHPGRTGPTRSLLVALVILIAGIGAGAVWLRGRAGAGTPGDEPGATAAVPRLPSVAVLPFANVSRDTADDPLADGLTEELI